MLTGGGQSQAPDVGLLTGGGHANTSRASAVAGGGGVISANATTVGGSSIYNINSKSTVPQTSMLNFVDSNGPSPTRYIYLSIFCHSKFQHIYICSVTHQLICVPFLQQKSATISERYSSTSPIVPSWGQKPCCSSTD